MRNSTFFCILLLVLAACGSREQKINAIDLQINVERFDRDLYELRGDSMCHGLDELRSRYGSFFEYYNTGIINIGDSRNALYCKILQRFLHHNMVDSAYAKVNEVFPDERQLNEELTSAFKHFKFYFPSLPTPRIITYISGFNEALMLTDSAVGVGLDQFLGSDYELYSKLGKAVYLQYNMRPARIPVACLQTWLAGEYPESSVQGSTLLARMIYEGKLLYVLEQCMPGKPLELLLGYSPEQLQWCLDNELQIWTHLVEQQLLYTPNPFIVLKYTGDAPFTAGFPQDSPGKAANWIGYRIVRDYAKRTKCSLPELMEMGDATQILKDARYNPN